MAGDGASPPQGVQGERVSGFVVGLIEAAAAPRGLIYETGYRSRDRDAVALPAGSLHNTPMVISGGPSEVIRIRRGGRAVNGTGL